jgi:hypothetical protein
MGAAGLEFRPMVGVDTSLPELPGLPTNELISQHYSLPFKGLHEGLLKLRWGNKTNTNFKMFKVILCKISFLCGSNLENIEQILNITLNTANVQWLHYFQYLY